MNSGNEMTFTTMFAHLLMHPLPDSWPPPPTERPSMTRRDTSCQQALRDVSSRRPFLNEILCYFVRGDGREPPS